jgi:hypothetical protein
METPQFPSNSKSTPPTEPRKVERVVTNEVKSRPKSVGRRLREALFGGDSKSAIGYAISEVVIPQTKDLIAEAGKQILEMIIFGDASARSRRTSGRPHGSRYTNYSQYASRGRSGATSIREDRPTVSPRSQSLDEIVFETRAEAEAVLEQLYDTLEEYHLVSVADLYTMLDWTSRSTHTDQKWGWESLQGSDIKITRGGYILILPKTVPLD